MESAREVINAEVRAALLTLGAYRYGWGATRDGLPLRPDVQAYVRDVLCAFGGGPLARLDAPPDDAEMDARGSLVLTFAGKDRRMLQVTIPCGGVVVARQFMGRQKETRIETRLAAEDPDRLEAEFDHLAGWLKGGDA